MDEDTEVCYKCHVNVAENDGICLGCKMEDTEHDELDDEITEDMEVEEEW